MEGKKIDRYIAQRLVLKWTRVKEVKRMKLTASITAFLLTIAFSGTATAGIWDTKCLGCHYDGNAFNAPTKDQILEKYKSSDEFVQAAMASKSKMMKPVQKEDVLKEAAKDLYK
jgi:hypothetical protein